MNKINENISAVSILNVKNLNIDYLIPDRIFGKKIVKAVENVSLDLYAGEIYGIAGESGCGKTTLVKAIMRLLDSSNTRISGIININFQEISANLLRIPDNKLLAIRKLIQPVFQDPSSSLNQRHSVYRILEEPLKYLTDFNKNDRKEIISEIIEKVGLGINSLSKFPNEFSTGQRQRIAIARALIIKPKILIADEPVSSLDISVQSQILNLLLDLKEEYNLSIIFISHDLSVLRKICNRISIMYLGEIVESGKSDLIFSKPSHPYSIALISSIPKIDFTSSEYRSMILGDVSSAINKPAGCYFHPRCPIKATICIEKKPILEEKSNERFSACHKIVK